VDFIEAENSMGFHADQEAARVLATSINESRLGEAALRGGGATITRSPAAPAQLVTPRGGGEGQGRGASGSH
jgi:nitrite reductase (cytochrome c-552)